MKKVRRLICIGLALASTLGVGAYAIDYSVIDAENLVYEESVNYAEIIIESCKDESEVALIKAAEAEIQRNKKIEGLDLDYETTKFFELLKTPEDIINAVATFAETGNVYGVTQYVVNADFLNCREEAGVESKRIGSIKKGSVVTYLTQETDGGEEVWYQVSSGKMTGWCKATFLEKYNEDEASAKTVSGAKSAAASKETASSTDSVTAVEASNYSDDDLFWLAAAITKEAGSNWITDEHQLMVGNVILNRVASSSYPNSIYGVLTQRGQYPWASRGTKVNPTERAYANAQRLLNGERVLPENVVYQSTVEQGSGVYTSVYDATLGNTTYFCYY